MPTEQYNPLAGGRGLGRSRLYAAMGKEQAFEAKRYEEELTAAEGAVRKETEGASLWSTLGSVGGALLLGLGTRSLKGAMKGAAFTATCATSLGIIFRTNFLSLLPHP